MRLKLEQFLFFFSIICVGNVAFVSCWDSYELDLFDLVEELSSQNFYEFFDISPRADSQEVRKAYRKLSMLWHPDKNPEEGAEQKFRNIVGVYEVLKDEQKRARYDRLLVEGMPDWRSGIYYFRRVRKLSIREISIALAIIITIGHYFVLWAQHFEKKLTLEDRMDEVKKRLEKKQKKKKAAPMLDEIDSSLQKFYDSLESPTLKQTLPYRFVMWLVYLATNAPSISKGVWATVTRKKEPAPESDTDSDEEYERHQAEVEERRRQKAQKNLQDLNPKTIEKSDISAAVNYLVEKRDDEDSSIKTQTTVKSKEWSDKEKSELIKAIVKFPAGTVNRWSKIAEMLDRSVNECVNMEKLIKSSLTSNAHSQLNASTWSATNGSQSKVSVTDEPTLSDKFADDVVVNAEKCVWSQEHQKLFEKALKEIGKDAPNRWDKIAESVPGKTKNDCIARYKELVATLAKK